MERTGSHPNTEVKNCRGGLVVAWVTVWEKASIFAFAVSFFLYVSIVFYSPNWARLNYCYNLFLSKSNYCGHRDLFKIVFEIRSRHKYKYMIIM